MRKGISPVVASIVLVLVVISLASAFLVFSGRLTQESTTGTEEAVGEATDLTSSSFSIQSVKGNEVFIRNTGRETIESGSLRVTFGGEEASYQLAPLEPGESGSLDVLDLWRFGPGEHRLQLEGTALSRSETVRIVPASGPVLDMRFEDGTGDVAKDFSGNGNDGTLKADPRWVEGWVGGALEFDGGQDHVFATGDYPLGSSSRTVSGWVRLHSTGDQNVINYGADSPNEAYGINVASGVWSFYAGGGAGFGTDVSADREWHHHTVTYEGGIDGTVTYYIDGEVVGQGTHTLSTADSAMYIGSSVVSGQFMEGVVDEVLVYDNLLEPSELYVMEDV